MKNIYYITRTNITDIGGGAIVRAGTIGALKKKGFNVIIVTPNYNSDQTVVDDNLIKTAFKIPIKFATISERIGLYEDYLDIWVKNTVKILSDIVKKNDIILATSGGELGCIKLASIVKQQVHCNFIVNFHDPINYTLVNGMKINNKFHVNREKSEYKYIKNADLIMTSSATHEISLINKYPQMTGKVFTNHFGYIHEAKIKPLKSQSGKISIVYGGAMGIEQSPEVLLEVVQVSDEVQIYYIGSTERIEAIGKKSRLNITYLPAMPHDQYLDFLQKNADIGFVSLYGDYFSACVPSKIYDYINIGLPILGALPNGDAMNIINNNRFGYAAKYNDIEGLKAALKELLITSNRMGCRDLIIENRKYWSMDYKVNELVELIHKLH